ncbi:MAG: hypothetical protein QOG22_3234, partial [Pseudonocardiales bacterium]|nr:hypothetical protein [Pseudonocardiales bacterium]
MSVTTFAGQQAYLANARSVGQRWRAYLSLVPLPIMVIAVAIVTPSFPFKQFYIGLAVGGLVMMVTISLAGFDSRQMHGHMAETFSLESLRKVSGWTVIENLPFDGVDVDHVVITPSGVLAVETKFFGLVAKGTAYERERAAAARRSASESARKVRSFLRSKKLHELVTVTPVLMVWGPGSPAFSEGHRLVDGVYVVRAEHPQLWSHLFQAPRVSVVDRAQVHTAIDEYLAKKGVADAEKTLPLR